MVPMLRRGTIKHRLLVCALIFGLFTMAPAVGLAGTTDAFDRPDGGLGSTETGLTWSVFNGNWGIRADRAKLLSARYRNTIAYATVDAGMASGFTVSADIALSTTPRRANAGLTLLYVSHANNLFCKVEVTPGNPGGLMSIGRRLNNVTTSLLAYRRDTGFVNGRTYHVSCGRSGNVVTMTVEGADVGSLTISRTLTSGELAALGSATRVGLRTHAARDEDDKGSAYDDFAVTVP